MFFNDQKSNHDDGLNHLKLILLKKNMFF